VHLRPNRRLSSIQVLPVYAAEERVPLQCFIVVRRPCRPGSQPHRWVLGQQALHQVPRYGVEVVWNVILHVYYLLECLPFLARFEWKVTADHLVDDDPQSPEIRAWRGHALLQHLWTYIQRGATKSALLWDQV
jgi:hypothetical protein